MVSSRTLTAVAGVALSLAVSGAVYLVTDSLLLFLFVPFVPFLFRGFGDRDGRGERILTARGDLDDAATVRECPNCGFRTADDEYDYCPRDGTRLR